MAAAGISSAAMERHLKKIYDCLNIGCNKKAVQEVDRLPKNVRDLTVFKALKSLALIRMYKRRQAFDILNEINPADDLDEVTLQTMTSCYKESVDVGRIVDLYEAASRRKPNDPEIMAHLFMAYVRVFNFKRQKEIALQMYKTFSKKKRLYSFWAIMSLVMQAQAAADKQLHQQQQQQHEQPNSPKQPIDNTNTDKKVCLSLAEKMSEKMIDDERTNEEIELYLIILRKQNKYEDEYKFLTGPICLRITDHLSWFNRRRAYLCLDLKMYSRAFKHYFPTLIQEYPDQIEYYQGLFKSAFLLDTEAPSQQQPVAVNEQQQPQQQSQSQQQQQQQVSQGGTPVKSSSALAECFDIVEKQCILALEPVDGTPANKDQSKGKGQQQQNTLPKNLSRSSSLNPNRKRLLRGPFMARLELYHTILSNETSLPQNVYDLCKSQFATSYPTLNTLLLDYFQAFSKKILCYFDLDHMIKLFKLSTTEREDFVKIIGDWVRDIQDKNQGDMSAYDMYHVQLNYNMLKHSMHAYETSDRLEDRLKLAKTYIDEYDENRHFGENANATEFQPVDYYCLLAVNSIMTNSSEVGNVTSGHFLSDSLLVSLITMLENAIANSPTNHQLKLCLLKLYSFIGASKQCAAVLNSLDIKHFQIDTLGHLLNPVLYNTGNYTPSKESLEACLEFYAHGVRECFEGLTTSYRDGRFSKIEEISGVLRRLSDSLNATQCVLLKAVVSNLNASTTDELILASQSFDPFKGLWRLFRCEENAYTIKDSRDFKVLRSLHFETNELVQKRQLETLEDEKLWLRLRYYLIRSVYIQLEHMHRSPRKAGEAGDKVAADNVAELDLGRREVEDLRVKIADQVTEGSDDKRYSYLEPEASSFRWKHINFDSLLRLVSPLVFISDFRELDSKVLDEYSANIDSILNDLEQQLAAIDSLVKLKQTLLSLTISVEFLSLCAASLVSLVHATSSSSSNANVPASQPSVASAKVSSSQTQQQVVVPKSKSIPQQMVNKTEAQLTKLSNLIKGLDVKALILDKVTGVEESLLSDPKHVRSETKCGSSSPLMARDLVSTTLTKVKEKLAESYAESLREIENTCRRKAKLLRL